MEWIARYTDSRGIDNKPFTKYQTSFDAGDQEDAQTKATAWITDCLLERHTMAKWSEPSMPRIDGQASRCIVLSNRVNTLEIFKANTLAFEMVYDADNGDDRYRRHILASTVEEAQGKAMKLLRIRRPDLKSAGEWVGYKASDEEPQKYQTVTTHNAKSGYTIGYITLSQIQ